MKRLSSDSLIYAFDAGMEAVAHVTPGEEVLFEAVDAFGGQVKREGDRLTEIDFSYVNPATGPLFVDGAEPGDSLAVHIERIELPEQGAIVTGKGMGVLGDEVDTYATKILPIRDGQVLFDRLKIPVSPMVGVIGVAPEKGSYPTGTAHRHGGNMDTKEIASGTTLYLPVFQPGALLALGDCHAAMGDGEVCVSGCEIPAEVSVKVELVEGKSFKWPIVERQDGFSIVVSLPSLDEAVKEATREAVLLLADRLSIDRVEAYLLASLGADIRISQLVDPNLTVKAFVPRNLIGSLL